MKNVCIITLGCKQNKYESLCMAKKLVNAGYNIVDFHSTPNLADIFIINTCAVTMVGEQKSKQQIAKILKINGSAKIIVCGCASQVNINNFCNEKNVFSCIGTEGKENIVDLINEKTVILNDIPKTYNSIVGPIASSTRSTLKIQDGCDRFCSYCLIPYLRGRSRSRDIDDILEEAKELAKSSKEIVLTGIDISSYSIDGKLALSTLMRKLSKIDALIHIGSLEVSIIDDKFLKVLQDMPNFVTHFHLSLQSGDDSVLKRMNRHYKTDEFYQKVQLIRQYFDEPNITTDIIVGFCGEGDVEFQNTCEFIKKVRFSHAHIFPYSKRKGTLSYKWEDLDKKTKKERVEILESINNSIEFDYLTKKIGKESECIIEKKEGNYFVGYSKDYIKIFILGSNVSVGNKYKIIYKQILKTGLVSEIVK